MLKQVITKKKRLKRLKLIVTESQFQRLAESELIEQYIKSIKNTHLVWLGQVR
jgi:hypothetical protein